MTDLQPGGSGAGSTVELEDAFAKWVHSGGTFHDAFIAGYDIARADLAQARARMALQDAVLEAAKELAVRHEGWQAGMGPCVCHPHVKFSDALKALDAAQQQPQHASAANDDGQDARQ